jgi:hypothetical protein
MLTKWAGATAREGENIGYPPPNKFIPDFPLVPQRLPLGKYGLQEDPKELTGGIKSKVFFKQDDKFD